MNSKKCPYCGLMNPDENRKCICGYVFDKELYEQISQQHHLIEIKQSKIIFIKKNQIGIIIFFSLLIIRYLWAVKSAQSSLDYASGLMSILLDSPIALIIAAIIQLIVNKIKKAKAK